MAVVIGRLLQPWAGVVGGVAGWYLSQQAGSNMVFAQCTAGRWWSVALLGLLGIALDVGGGLLSWNAWRHERRSGGGREFVALLGLLIAGLLVFPILMQIIAGLLVPGCAS